MPTDTKRTLPTVGLFVSFAVAGGLAHAAHYDLDTSRVRSGRQLVPFATELTRWSHADAARPASLESMLGSTSFAMIGDLVGVNPGRKAFAGVGCDDQDELSGRCKGNPNAVIYDSYVNIVVKPTTILRGQVAVSNAPVSVEVPWPNNMDVAELKRTFPAKTRVIVIGEPTTAAAEETAPLVARGLARQSDVAPNLLSVPAYGFIMESAEGVVAPMWDNGPLVEGAIGDVFASFDRATTALRAAAPNAIERPALKVPLPRPAGSGK